MHQRNTNIVPWRAYSALQFRRPVCLLCDWIILSAAKSEYMKQPYDLTSHQAFLSLRQTDCLKVASITHLMHFGLSKGFNFACSPSPSHRNKIGERALSVLLMPPILSSIGLDVLTGPQFKSDKKTCSLQKSRNKNKSQRQFLNHILFPTSVFPRSG